MIIHGDDAAGEKEVFQSVFISSPLRLKPVVKVRWVPSNCGDPGAGVNDAGIANCDRRLFCSILWGRRRSINAVYPIRNNKQDDESCADVM